MKRTIKNLFFLLVAGMLLAFMGAAVNDAKTIRITPEVQKGKTKTIYTVKKKKGKTTIKKVTAKSSDKSVASVKVVKANGGKKYCVKVTGKKTGSAVVTIKVKKKIASGKIKTSTVKYKINVISIGKEDSDSDWTWNPDESNSSRMRNPLPSVTAAPAQTATPTQTATPIQMPYQAKYSYEVSVLNQFTIYENELIVLYVKTDNPDPNDFNNVLVSFGFPSGLDVDYADIEYLEQDESRTTFFNKVKGGWIYTGIVKTPGIHTIEIQELEKGENNKNSWRTVDTFQIEVKDGAAARKAFCEKVIQTVSSEDYNEDELGKWSSFTEQQKMERLAYYIRENMNYPRHDKNSIVMGGYKEILILQENVGASWETGFADCAEAAELLCDMAKMLGIEAYVHATTGTGGLAHLNVQVVLDGKEYYYDGTPWVGGYKNWDYIQLDKY